MLSVKSSTLCVLLCLGFVTANVDFSVKKNEKYYGNSLLKSVNIHNSLMASVSCSEYYGTSRKCIVSHTTLDDKSKSVSCEFKLHPGLHYVHGHPLSATKAVLISKTSKNDNKQYVKYTIFNFPHCRTTEYEINFESNEAVDSNYQENKDAIWINEDETFDILHNDAKVCGDKVCRLQLNAEGEKLSGPYPSFISLVGSVRHVERVPSSQNFIVTEYKRDGGKSLFLVSLVTCSGQQLVLKKYNSYENLKSHDVSASHGLIRICTRNNDIRRVECELFDENSSNATSKTRLDVSQKVENVVVKNLEDGQFIVLVEGEDTDSVVKVNSDGSIYGAVELFHFPRRSHLALESYIDVTINQFCVTRRGNYYYGLKVVKECFNNGDFHSSKVPVPTEKNMIAEFHNRILNRSNVFDIPRIN